MIIVYVTCGSKEEAKKIADFAVKNKLAACANYFPINSVYKWKGKIENDKEFVLLLKTVDKNFGKLKSEIRKMHSYEIPCIMKIDADANKEYADWVKKQVE